jgi:hypothetical protein
MEDSKTAHERLSQFDERNNILPTSHWLLTFQVIYHLRRGNRGRMARLSLNLVQSSSLSNYSMPNTHA